MKIGKEKRKMELEKASLTRGFFAVLASWSARGGLYGVIPSPFDKLRVNSAVLYEVEESAVKKGPAMRGQGGSTSCRYAPEYS
ncbi:MAG: hypothetical protein UX58_C0003G0050 [Candidatus Wolfebacteria bacterium GW2011_GWB2_46_69]|nr:MAG: hypothetical protein UX58_C0003G0050 [Candidatus Wolfebacteria bacterium GW2011_GWB2_46_69]